MSPRSEPRTKPQPLRARMKEEARLAILEAAEQVIGEQGLAAARMEDIAARVGVSVGTLYNYFADRQRLFQALREARAQQLFVLLDAELERGQDAPYRTRLHGLLRTILEDIQTHYRFFALLMEECPPRGASPNEELEHHQRMWNEVSRRVERLNEDGIARGELRPEDAAHYPTLLLGMLQSTLLQRLIERRPLSIEEQLDVLLRCFLEGARPRPG